VTRIMNQIVLALCVLVCMAWSSSCASVRADDRYITRPLPNAQVLLVPELQGGRVGWCMATIVGGAEGSSGCGGSPVSTGPIIGEGCEQNESRIDLFVLTTSEVKAVSAGGGPQVPTKTNPTLPNGMRAAALEVVRNKGLPSGCREVTPLNASGVPIRGRGKRRIRLAFTLPDTRHWTEPRLPPPGACRLTVSKAMHAMVAYSGEVATKVKPYHGLVGHALLSCLDTIYIYQEEHHLPSAVLLNAEHPGATPPPLPGMSPLVGHRGIFEAPGSEGTVVARRIPGAWLVVQEEDGIGLSVPVKLLERLRATIQPKVIN
jgi:hypothetical protein